MMSGSPLRLTMRNVRCVVNQTRAFATPLFRYLSPADLQTPANRGLLLRNARLLHTSAIRNADKPNQENTAKTHEKDAKNLVLKDRLKFVVAEYGTTAILFHISISLTSLGICYTAVKRLVDHCVGGGRGRLLPIMAYMGRLYPKGVPFSCFR